MVSKASELLPEPDTPLITVSLPCGISQEMFFRLCVRAPRMVMNSFKRQCTGAEFGPPPPCSLYRPKGATSHFLL